MCNWYYTDLLAEQFKPVLSTGNARHVHHLTVSDCDTDNPSVRSVLEALMDGAGDDSHSVSKAPLLRAYSHVVVAWATGSQVS